MKLNLRNAIIGAALAVLSIGSAFALSNDQTRIFNKRFDPDGYHPSYYRFTLNFNDTNIGTAQKFGALGNNEFIKAIDCQVTTAFNAGTFNSVTIGSGSPLANDIVGPTGGATAAITPGTPAMYHLTTANGLGITATSGGDITLYARYVQTGTAATTGAVTCVMEFVPNNDM